MLREACIVKKQLATLNEIGIVTLKGNQLDQQYHNPHTLPPKLLLPFKHCRLQVQMSDTVPVQIHLEESLVQDPAC